MPETWLRPHAATDDDEVRVTGRAWGRLLQHGDADPHEESGAAPVQHVDTGDLAAHLQVQLNPLKRRRLDLVRHRAQGLLDGTGGKLFRWFQ